MCQSRRCALEPLYSREEIAAAVRRLGEEITRDYEGRELHVIGVLRGAAVFASHLIQQIDLPLSLDFIGMTSYASSPSSGVVRITKDLDESIWNRSVLVVEGIVDTGLTLSYVLRSLKTRKPASLEVCTLLDKSVRRIIDLPLSYVGFEIPDVFVVGYGLDWDQKYRNLPYIAEWKVDGLTG